jgi:septum formation protein
MLFLGSSSPARMLMIKRIYNGDINVLHPDVDESVLKNEKPSDYAKRISGLKLQAVMEKVGDLTSGVIICCDTVCSRGRLILPKAETNSDVEECMRLLSGRNHDVFTSISAVNLSDGRIVNKISHTRVKFKNLSKKDISDMVNFGDGIGKAGGYTINGFAESFIIKIIGQYSNIVGLPLYETRNILMSFGIL